MDEAEILVDGNANSADGKSFSLKQSGDQRNGIISSTSTKKRSLDLRTTELPGIPIRKTKSLSAQFLINVDELINNINATSSAMLSRASSNGLGFFPITESVLHSDDTSDIQNPNKINEEDPDSRSWRKMCMEPTLPISLKFEDVKYAVTMKGKKQSKAERCILHGVTGSVRPGEVLALMGPSGGGKTTLLNLLSGRFKINSGSITYNDRPYNKSLNGRIGFVFQDDVVFPHLTVKETLTYAALLRLPNTLTKEQKKERAMNVIGELDLERCQNSIIGGAFVSGISGGERKRVCIGNEILLNPSLLFLDEPTSGLDSTTALRIVQMLQDFAQAGKTVVTTIHQPSSRLFTKFDKVILLGKGNSLYSGKPSEAMPYFSSIGCSPRIAMNPAEFLIDLANGNIKDKSVPSELKDKFLPCQTQNLKIKEEEPSPNDVHEYLVGAYEARVASKKKYKNPKSMLVEGGPQAQGWSNSREWGAPWWEQFSILFRRGLKERRHEYFSSIRVTQVISTAIILGLLWWHSDASSPRGLQDQAGLLYFISVFWAFFPLFTAIFTFPQERAMLVKERSVDMYKLSAYIIARNTSDLPLDLILPIVFLAIVYFMVGLKRSLLAFIQTLLTIFLSIIASQGLGLTIGAAFMDVKKATMLASTVVMAFMLAGGFFIANLPYFMTWIRYISFNYHTYRLLLKIQYSCSSDHSEPGSDSCEYPFVRKQKLDAGGAEIGAMLLMIIGYRMLAYLFLRRMQLRKVT